MSKEAANTVQFSGLQRLAARIFPDWYAGRLYDRWFQVRRTETNTREWQILESARHFMLQVGEVQLAAYEWQNTGPAVLLVHGWSGRAGQMADIATALWRGGCRVLAFDARGHGASKGTHTHVLETLDAIRATQTYLGEVAATVAHSYGAVSVVYAASQGVQLGDLVLIAPTALPEQRLAEFLDWLEVPVAVRKAFQARIDRQFGPSWWQRIAPLNLAPQLACRGLLIHDRKDRIVPHDEAVRLHQAWPESSLLLTEGLGHQKLLRDPLVIKAVTEFVL